MMLPPTLLQISIVVEVYMTTSNCEFVPVHMVERAAGQLIETFETAIVSAIETGSLLTLRWHLHWEEQKVAVELQSNVIPDAKKIEARWIEIEKLHGEGSLLVEESRVVQYSLSTPGGRHEREPHLLENARQLRNLKGPEWWQREHQLRSLLEEVRSCTH
ncbi:hypothetical protein LJR098_004209 [Rhizobium sp. LjRoot98]|uniref:hypothetical protein n=1 Tax=Rhizobium sp. LjRoot98 TaxID=3342345 RepID=UPI003ECC430F